MTRWAKGICEANGISIHYLRTGGDKPPIVLLHGLMTNGACWTPVARILEENYDVIMPDARGHGNSSAPNHGYCYYNLANDVLSLIEILDLHAPVLLGHSMGGMTAALVANQDPKRLRGLILADPTFLTPHRQWEVYESNISVQHRQILKRPREDVFAEIQIRNSHRSHELIELLLQARFQTSIHAFEILTPPNPDYMELIKTLDIPCLLVIGGDGAVISPLVAEELARLNQCLEVVQIAEAGHGIHYDQPNRFSAVVKVFLQSVNARCVSLYK
jgi:pimeloyl-ACP methyl ester carboxylesterase